MQLVMLAGELGEKYGKQHEYYNLRTPADAIKLLCSNFPQLQRDLMISHHNGVGYKLIQAGAAMGYDELQLPFGSKPLLVVPVITGAGGSTGQILAGVGLVAAAIILPKANSEPVSSKTSQLIAIRLNPKPISEIMLPKKNSKNVLLLNIFSMSAVPLFYFVFKG